LVKRAEPIDVLIVGEHRADLASPLIDNGLRIAVSPGLFPAIAVLRRQGARIVVLGHEEIDGRGANPIHAIRSSENSTRVLLMHPESASVDAEQLTGIGADEHLAEPCYPEQLLRTVQGLLLTSRDCGRRSEPPTGPAPSVHEILRQLHRAARDLPELRATLVRSISLLTGARRASLMMHRPSSGELYLAEGSGLPDTVRLGTRIGIGDGVAGRVAERARPVVVQEIGTSEFGALARGDDYATASFISVPLVADARILGVLSLADRADGKAFTKEDLDRILPITDLAATIFKTAMLIRRLRAASLLDPLTGLYNRRHFDRARVKEFKRARRYERPLSLVLVDADRFKCINDAEGHPAGDETLRVLSRTMKAAFRETDIVCRYGGDEFAVLMPETDHKHAEMAVERLHTAIGKTEIPGERHVPGGKFRVSCGVGTYPGTYPGEARTADDLVRLADKNLYADKEQSHGAEAPTPG
jgi:diguanylate cyclase (GGDEF)-like protein